MFRKIDSPKSPIKVKGLENRRNETCLQMVIKPRVFKHPSLVQFDPVAVESNPWRIEESTFENSTRSVCPEDLATVRHPAKEPMRQRQGSMTRVAELQRGRERLERRLPPEPYPVHPADSRRPSSCSPSAGRTYGRPPRLVDRARHCFG